MLINSIQMPRVEMMTFDGDPLKYWEFARAFENCVEREMVDENSKLTRLLHYCSGKAKKVIQCCLVMKPSEGFTRAKHLLKERFGDDYTISEAWIQKVTTGAEVKPSDKLGLMEFSDDLQSCKETLQAMDRLCEISGQSTLVNIIGRLPIYLQDRWRKSAYEIRKKSGRSPKIGDVVNFVRVSAEEANDPVFGRPNKVDSPKDKATTGNNSWKAKVGQRSKSSSNFNVQVDQAQDKTQTASDKPKTDSRPPPTCYLCGGAHTLFSCDTFKGKSPADRLKFTRSKQLCDNCLGQGHRAFNCKLDRKCSVPGCGKKHTKFLHVVPQSTGTSQDKTTQPAGTKPSTKVHNGYVKMKNTHGAGVPRTILPVVPVRVSTMKGDRFFDTLALLDGGSTNTFCSESLARKLGLEGTKTTLSLTTLEKTESESETKLVSLQVSGVGEEQILELPHVFVRDLPVPKNVAAPSDVEHYPHLRGIDIPCVDHLDVTLLIGQDVPEALVPLDVKRGKPGEPYATRTCLGWTLNGPVAMEGHCNAVCNFITLDARLENQVKQFWEMENMESAADDAPEMSVNDRKVISIWDETATLADGHYQLDIPFRSRPPSLPYNRSLAEHRVKLLQRRFEKDPVLYERYKVEMSTLLVKGYAEEVPAEELSRSDGGVWYLPHHPVLNEKKPDKLRIVFDCAAKWQGTSLNDNVYQGPDMMNSLVGILMRFRQYPVAVMADIEAMFNQVHVTPKDRDALRYLWWEDGDTSKELKVYRMKGHLFGGVWCPSCAGYALKRTAEDNREGFKPETVETVQRSFYVDDCLKSLMHTGEAAELAMELCSLLRLGGFRLVKFLSNKIEVLEAIPPEARAKGVKELEFRVQDLPTERALGVKWNVESDKLGYSICLKEKPTTRRGILSIISSVYDPLGLISPFILPAKLILQEMSRQQLGWDDPLPQTLFGEWTRWMKDLPKLESFGIDRCLRPENLGDVVESQLHHFSDASTKGYGAASYLRTIDKLGQVHCALVIGKSKLNPLKTLSIPRLELAAAVVAVKLDKHVRRELEIAVQESYFWTDSTLVLQYIKNEDKRFLTFVANRVALIHSGTSPEQWKYVDTANNPADDASRGISAEELLSGGRWLHGPDFLWSSPTNWPTQPAAIPQISDQDPEVKKSKAIVCAVVAEPPKADMFDDLMNRYSSWNKLKRVWAWILRFKKILLSRLRKADVGVLTSSLSVPEIKEAELEIVKLLQSKYFSEEIEILRGGKTLKKSGKLYRLEPLLDNRGILRIGGRLEHAPVSEEARHQAILPRDSHITTLVIRFHHGFCGHSGREYVLSSIRSRYWIVNGRSAVDRVLRDCVKCKRVKGPTKSQQMAVLPVDRVTPFKPPFTFVGVDCFGPFWVKLGRNSGLKRYGCLFTCLSIRAVHIEILHSMDTNSFVNGLQRFICRRGPPEKIRSDNGTNFKGGDKELRRSIQEWNQDQIEGFLQQKEIAWEYNPPAASHMGGIWERQIRSVRKILAGVLAEQPVHDEVLSTLFCLVESIINGRPITPVSSDPNDLEPLTPNHLLLMRPAAALPPGIFVKEDIFRKRWRHVQYLSNLFWHRWLKEYLPTLQLRTKWYEPKENLNIGDIVLVKDETTPRNLWPLARVIETHPAKDGKVRSVVVKTKSTVLTRPIVKLCLLESVEA
jgi:hypothetical protein